ncbi:PAS domain-containing protein [Acetobacteraceae bacterium H6797]|nr:PAS domain-containing protein [Acetobacteraceae bacterium H6797]
MSEASDGIAKTESARPAGRPLRFGLALLCVTLALPVLLVLIGLLYGHWLDVQARLRGEATDQAQAVGFAIDQEIAGLSALLDLMVEANGPPGEPDIQAFASGVRASLDRLGVGLRVDDGEGRNLLSLGPEAPPLRLDERRRAVSDLVMGSAGQMALISRELRRAAAPPLVFTLVLPVKRLRDMVRALDLPNTWRAMLIDGDGHIANLSGGIGNTDRWRPPEERLLRLSGAGGAFNARSALGERLLVGYHRSSVGWRVAVSLPASEIEGPLLRQMLWLSAGVMLLMLLAFALAWRLARHIARAGRALVGAAERLVADEPIGSLPPEAPCEFAAVAQALGKAQQSLQTRRAEILENEMRQRRAVAAGKIGTWELDLRTGKLTGSAGREALYGRGPGEISSGEKFMSVVHPEDWEITSRALEEARNPIGTGHYALEFRVIWPDGQIRWLRSQGAPVETDQSGTVLKLAGVIMDVTAQKEAAERERLLAGELDHRARNILAVVQSIVRMTRHQDPRHFAEVVEGRIAALGRAHTLLSRERWQGADLRQLVTDELAPYLESGRVRLDGPALPIMAVAVQPLAMVVHELATNAVKHGALSMPSGKVFLRWEVRGSELHLIWRETGGPALAGTPPQGSGFGAKLINATLRGQLAGRIEWLWLPEGLECRLAMPAARAMRRLSMGLPQLEAEAVQASLVADIPRFTGCRVLIAEDEAPVALELENSLRDLGCEVVGPAATLEAASRLAAGEPVDIAVLDVNLGGQASFPVADLLLSKNVPVIFATGYSDLKGREAGERTILLRKPLDRGALEAALARLLATGPCQAPRPSPPQEQTREGEDGRRAG